MSRGDDEAKRKQEQIDKQFREWQQRQAEEAQREYNQAMQENKQAQLHHDANHEEFMRQTRLAKKAAANGDTKKAALHAENAKRADRRALQNLQQEQESHTRAQQNRKTAKSSRKTFP